MVRWRSPVGGGRSCGPDLVSKSILCCWLVEGVLRRPQHTWRCFCIYEVLEGTNNVRLRVWAWDEGVPLYAKQCCWVFFRTEKELKKHVLVTRPAPLGLSSLSLKLLNFDVVSSGKSSSLKPAPLEDPRRSPKRQVWEDRKQGIGIGIKMTNIFRRI